ncbi:MAG TPA: tRNA lysidine(34) synthetase TilS [Flavobacterium sp.]|jgi:tRNA(Ile)-lysidine synthase
MLNKLREHLSANFPFLIDGKLLLAVSGGLDSIAMVALFHKLDYNFAIAHCNFQLRGEESDSDLNFVRQLAENRNIPIFTTVFGTQAFASDYKLSVQVAARNLRYSWFQELADAEGFDYILTAHHADDNLETFLINLSRGTGIDGLTGIPLINDKIIRPLLPFSRSEIELYAKDDHLEWREDSSNASDKYLRNQIRHDVVPKLKELNPDFLVAFQKTQSYLQQTATMADDAAIMIYQQVAQQANDEIHFNLQKLTKLGNFKAYLHQWLKEFGFTAWNDIYDLVGAQSGKQVFSPTYKLFKTRHFLVLAPIKEADPNAEYYIAQGQNEVNFPINLTISKADAIERASNKVIFVDADKIRFPLMLRKCREADFFYPFGMNGQRKKISKQFKDEHLSLSEKENIWILCSGGEIVWIIGIRPDERFKVEPTTTNILQIATT